MNVVVPPGVDVQHQLKVAGQGDAGRRGGAAGDIRVRLNIAPHPTFSRDGNDVHVAVAVPLTTAALGGSVTVPTLGGEAVLKVDAGTQPGDRRVMRGKGIRDVSGRSGLQGNQYVTFNIKVPTDLTPQQRSTLELFAAQRGDRQQPPQPQQTHDGSQSGGGSSGSGGSGSGSGSGSESAAEATDTAAVGTSSSPSAAGFFSSLFGGSTKDSSEQKQQQQRQQQSKKQTAGGGSHTS